MSKISTIVVIVASPTASAKILMIKLLLIRIASTLSLELTKLMIFFCVIEGSLLQYLLAGDLFLLLCVVVLIDFHESRACCGFLLGLMVHAQK